MQQVSNSNMLTVTYPRSYLTSVPGTFSTQEHQQRMESVTLARKRGDGRDWEIARDQIELGKLLVGCTLFFLLAKGGFTPSHLISFIRHAYF